MFPECYRLLDIAIEKSVSKKRRKREVPIYYSSTTMHCLNKLSTARKQHNFPKIRDLKNEFANRIEIGQHFLLAKTCNFSTNEAFALRRKLNGRNCIPTKIFLRNESASDNLEKANLFNTFFSSVYQPSSEMNLKSFVFQDVVCLSEVNFSVEEIQSQLLKIPDCSTAACDGVPPTIYNRALDILAPFVYLMFIHVKESFTWPNLWKCAHFNPIHKKGSRADVEKHRPISILPRTSLILKDLFSIASIQNWNKHSTLCSMVSVQNTQRLHN